MDAPSPACIASRNRSGPSASLGTGHFLVEWIPNDPSARPVGVGPGRGPDELGECSASHYGLTISTPMITVFAPLRFSAQCSTSRDSAMNPPGLISLM